MKKIFPIDDPEEMAIVLAQRATRERGYTEGISVAHPSDGEHTYTLIGVEGKVGIVQRLNDGTEPGLAIIERMFPLAELFDPALASLSLEAILQPVPAKAN